MRKLVLGGAVIALVLALSACGGSSKSSATDETQLADEYAIREIEENFHESISKKDIAQFMSLWAPHATFSFRGKTSAGIQQIRGRWLKSDGFKPETHWVSDVKSEKVASTTAADMDVARIDGRWLITRMVGGTAELSP